MLAERKLQHEGVAVQSGGRASAHLMPDSWNGTWRAYAAVLDQNMARLGGRLRSKTPPARQKQKEAEPNLPHCTTERRIKARREDVSWGKWGAAAPVPVPAGVEPARQLCPVRRRAQTVSARTQ